MCAKWGEIQIKNKGIENVWARHKKQALAFQEAMRALGLEFVPRNKDIMSVTLSAIKYPKNVNATDFLTFVKEWDVIFAGGLHKEIKNQYFRVGHMGVSTKYNNNHILKCVEAVEYALRRSFYKINGNIGIQKYQQCMNDNNNNNNNKGCPFRRSKL